MAGVGSVIVAGSSYHEEQRQYLEHKGRHQTLQLFLDWIIRRIIVHRARDAPTERQCNADVVSCILKVSACLELESGEYQFQGYSDVSHFLHILLTTGCV